MATQDSLNFVQQLYVAYYGRPADSAGLQYWAQRADTDGRGSIIASFGESREFQDEYGNLGNEALVKNLYQQLFGRDAEPEGLAYYTGVLDRGEKALSEIAVTIFNSAEGADKDVFDARVDAANGYTEQFGGSAYNAQDGRDIILAIVPEDNGSGGDTDDSDDIGGGENGSESAVDEVLIGKLQSLQAEYKDWVDYRKTMTDDGSPITYPEFYQRFEAAEDAYEQAYAQKPTSEIEAEYAATQTQRDQAQEALDKAFTKTTFAGEDATQGEIQAELIALEDALNQAGGKLENGVAQPSGAAGLEVKAYNDFDNVADAFTALDDALYRDAGNPADKLSATRQEVDNKLAVESASDEERQQLIQQKLENLPSGDERNELVGLSAKLNSAGSEFNQLKVERDAALEQVGDAFSETTFEGSTPDDQAIEDERAALQVKVEVAGGEVNMDSGSLRAYADNATGVDEAIAYNDFKDKANALKIAQDDFADAQQTLDVRNALQDELRDLMYAEEDLASLTLTIAKTEDYYSEPDNQYEVPVSIEGDVSATDDEDLFLFYGTDATITGFDPENGDQLFIGEQFTRTDLAAGVDIGTTAQGSNSDLDVFFQQAGNDALLTFEDAVEEGSATNNPFMAEVTLTGVNMDNLSVENGFVSIA